jgi:malate dehydrogenase (oxaloacetate-decarboxylating)
MSQRSDKWDDIVERLHKFYRGKIEVVPKCPIASLDDFSIWYSPGVAEPCRRIYEGAKTCHMTIHGGGMLLQWLAMARGFLG